MKTIQKSLKLTNWSKATNNIKAVILTPLVVALLTFGALAQNNNKSKGKTFEDLVGHGKVNIVDFRGPKTGGLALIFRLEYMTFESVPSDGFFGPITKGKMRFSYPRQDNPERAYDKSASLADKLTKGPAFGDVVEYQAREIAPNIFEIHWVEPSKGDVVTHVEDFNREQIVTNFVYINRVPIPAAFDALDLSNRLDNKTLFPDGNPVLAKDFPFYTLAGKMSQSLISDKVWEKMHMLVYDTAK